MPIAESLVAWLRENPNHQGILLVAAAAYLEYVFPPFPGDLVIVFAAFSVIRFGWSLPLVLIAVLIGSLGGSLTAYGVGRWLGKRWRLHPPTWPLAKRCLEIAQSLKKRGAAWLLINRFFPSVRALFFVAAGLAEIPSLLVAIYGLISAFLWSSFLLLIGLLVGSSWDRIAHFFVRYTQVAFVLVAIVAAILLWRYRREQRKKNLR